MLNAPGTVLDPNVVTSRGVDEFWAIRIAEDPGDPKNGAGAGTPENVLVSHTVAAGDLNGIRVDAGRLIVLESNILAGVPRRACPDRTGRRGDHAMTQTVPAPTSCSPRPNPRTRERSGESECSDLRLLLPTQGE